MQGEHLRPRKVEAAGHMPGISSSLMPCSFVLGDDMGPD